MKILFLAVCKYPDGDANAVRQHAFATILKQLGHEVTILSLNRAENIEHQEFEGISYLALKGRYLDCKKQLEEYLLNSKVPDMMFLNAIPLPAFLHAKKYAIKNNIPLVHDAVEWHSIDQYSLTDGYGLICILSQSSIINRFILDKNFKVISISSYLDSYFINKGIKSVRIPVIMNVSQISSNKQQPDVKLHITYAGSPKGKDYLTNIISAIEMLDENERELLDFTLLGVNESDLADSIQKPVGSIEKLKCINARGRVLREDVLKYLAKSDFTILIRSEKARYAKAGFPTKVVESLSSATPIILNITSDLGMYLRDSYDCLTVASENPEDIASTLRRALTLSLNEKKCMGVNARKTAEENFEITKYSKVLKNFLEV